MKNGLSTAKMLLIQMATDIYTDRRGDLETHEYPEHYHDLGKIVARIDEYRSLSSMIRDMESGDYSQIGIDGTVDSEVIDFLIQVSERM